MSRFIGIYLLFFTAICAARTFDLGLDYRRAEVKEKMPVVIYIGNDIMASANDQYIDRGEKYVQALLNGEQYHHLSTNKPVFSQEDIDSIAKFSEDERQFMRQVSQYITHEVSRRETIYDDEMFLNGICQPNPKYVAGYVTLRNRKMAGPLRKDYPEISKFPWLYCVPGKNSDTKFFEKKTSPDGLGESIFEFPYSEQPVTHFGMMKKVFGEILEIFPADRHRFIIIVHSTAAPGEIIGPQFAAKYDALPIDSARKALLENRQAFLNEKGELRKDRGFANAWNETFLKAGGLKRNWGITNDQFFRLLSEHLGGAPVTLVGLDVNAYDLREITKEKLLNVGTVFQLESSSPAYEAVNYQGLFRYVGVPGKDIEVRLRDYLK